MLVLTLNAGAQTTFTNRATGEVIAIELVRGGDSPRIGIKANLEWDIVRSDAKKKHVRPIQSSESDVSDLGRRAI